MSHHIVVAWKQDASFHALYLTRINIENESSRAALGPELHYISLAVQLLKSVIPQDVLIAAFKKFQ